MAADSNTVVFHQGDCIEPLMNRNVISFQSGAVNSSSSSEMIGMGSYYGGSGSLVFSGSSGGMIGGNSDVVVTQAGNSIVLDSVNGLKHDTGLAVEWSTEEQYKLEEGLAKHADEPSILSYIKIAATLREKTVRDVALRCRWMTRKRRKYEDSHLSRKGSYRKEKLLEPPQKTNLTASPTPSMATPSFSMHQMDHNERIKWGMINRTARQLMEQNIQVFGQINQNLSSLKLDDNVALFCRTRENINNLCTIMKSIPGRISQMQEFPVSINQELADSVLPRSTQMMMLNMSSGVPLKQDLRYDGALPRSTFDQDSRSVALP